jgi:uncharacterized protein YcfL
MTALCGSAGLAIWSGKKGLRECVLLKFRSYWYDHGGSNQSDRFWGASVSGRKDVSGELSLSELDQAETN